MTGKRERERRQQWTPEHKKRLKALEREWYALHPGVSASDSREELRGQKDRAAERRKA